MTKTEGSPAGAFDRLLRGAGATFLIYVGGAGLGYVVQTSLARWLGPDGYGAVAYLIGWVDLFAMVAGLGLAYALLRFVPAYRATGKAPLASAYLRIGRRVTVAGGLVAAAGLSLTGGIGILRGEWAGVWRVGVWAIPLLAVLVFQMQEARAAGRIAIAFLPRMVLRHVVFLGVMAALIYGFDMRVTAPVAAAVFVTAVGAVTFGQWVALRRDRAREAGPAERGAWPVREWSVVSATLLGGAFLALLLQRLDLFILGMLRPATEVGLYNAAARTAGLAAFVVVAINAAVAPDISALHAKGDLDRLERLVRRFSRLALLGTLGIAGGLALLGRFILSLFGPEFTASYAPLVILLGGYVVAAAVGLVVNLLNLTGHQTVTVLVYAVAAAASIGLNLLLIPPYGAIGAATATLVSMAAVNLMLLGLVRRRLGIDPSVLPKKGHHA